MKEEIFIYDNVLLFTPLDKKQLVDFMEKNYFYDDKIVVFEGDNDYLAFMDSERRIAIGEELDLIKDLSNLSENTCYSLWTDDSDINCTSYHNGKAVDSKSRDIFTFAEELGIQLPNAIVSLQIPNQSFCLTQNVH